MFLGFHYGENHSRTVAYKTELVMYVQTDCARRNSSFTGKEKPGTHLFSSACLLQKRNKTKEKKNKAYKCHKMTAQSDVQNNLRSRATKITNGDMTWVIPLSWPSIPSA